MRRTLYSLCCWLFASTTAGLFAQSWVDGMRDHRVNFYEVQRNFEEAWENKEVEKGKGWVQFKRWEHFTEERVYPSGERPNPSVWYTAVQQMQQSTQNTVTIGNWRPLGPFDGNVINGIGRLNCIAFDPINQNVIYVGAPSGGLWKSTDGGFTWITTTDQLTNLGVSAIAIDPNNTNHLFIATGDRDAGDSYSYGVMESTDGGMTWQATGMQHNLSNTVRATGLHLNPSNPLELILTTLSGIFKTNDGGQNWSSVQGGAFQSIHQKWGNPNVLFATTTPSARIWMSTNGGDNWTQLNPATTGLPNNARRMEMAVTPADTNYIYALAAGSDNGFLGLYRSVDGGLSWTLRSSTPNLMGWSTTGSDNGGQGWYDLCVAVAPDNRNEVYTGGVNIWRSTNGGQSWSINAHWFGGGGAPYVHADIHDLEFQPGTNTLFACTDGGLHVTQDGGNTWVERQDGMNITQYYKIATSDADSVRVIGGTQDNGTHLRAPNTFWDRIRGGDGMDCGIDHSDPLTMYASVYYGDFTKSTNGGLSMNASFNLPPAGTGNWVTPFVIDPNNSSILYAGFESLWKSTNKGISFTNVSGNLNSTNMDLIHVPKVNSDHVYVGINSLLYKSVNGGQNFSLISNGIPGNGTITGVAVDDADQSHVWVTRSGYSMGQKVYESFDGGNSWTNISGILPNIPVNCILYQDTAVDGVYVGTDIGVYYKNNLLPDWVPFMNGLPNVIIRDLEYHPLSDKIRAGTYGRGIWESPAYRGDLMAPVARIAPVSSPCNIGDVVTLRSRSLNFPDRYRWSIDPPTFSFVNGTTDSSAMPEISFSQLGWYHVSLFVENANGKDSITELAFLRVGGISLPFTENFENSDSLGAWTVVNPDGVPGLGWQQVSAVGKAGGPTKAARMDLYAYATNGALVGRKDHLISPALDFSTHQNISLSYDHAYARRNGQSYDTLIVSVSTNCGQTWTEVQRRVHGQGSGLATRSNVTNAFVPTQAADWCGLGAVICSSVDLSAFDGMSGVQVRFTTVSNRGNRLYLDNININGTAATMPMADFAASRTACAQYDVSYLNLSAGVVDSVRWIFNGAQPSTSTLSQPTVRYSQAGSYPVELRVYNALGEDTLVRNAYIQVQPNADVQLSLNVNSGFCANTDVQLSLNQIGQGSNPTYEWFVNGTAVGIDDSVVALSGLQTGDWVYAQLVSSESCAWPAVAYSDTLNIVMNPNPMVTAGPMAPVCIADGPQWLNFGAPSGGIYTGPGVVNDTLYPNLSGSGVKIITYTFTDSLGCSSSANRSVQVSSKPVFSVGNQVVCNNDASYTPNWISPSGGLYIFNGDTVQSLDGTLLNVGSYNMEYYFQNGACDSTLQFTFDVVAAPQQPGIVQSNDTLYSSLTGDSYRWYRDGLRITGANGANHFPTQSGYYQVEIRDANGCANRSDSLLIQTSFGLEEQLNRSFSVFPNPNQGVFQVRLPSWAQGELTVINAAGQELIMQAISGGQTTYSLALDLPTGVYLLRFRSKEQVVSRRMIIE